MPTPQIVLLVVLGFVPSIIWLNFYFREDCHPEPKHLLTKVFLMGIIISPLAIIFQILLVKCGTIPAIQKLCLPLGFLQPASPEFLLWSAFVEEVVKFYAVRIVILNNVEFDEPIDAMIYMMVAALGFAAIENILIVFQTTPEGFTTTVNTLILRFIGATLLSLWTFRLLSCNLVVFSISQKKTVNYRYNTSDYISLRL
ncbi:MAG: Protease prsW [bacterium]|nr:MAG: Protease prsW [bacterium]